jgi:hypothetical protein
MISTGIIEPDVEERNSVAVPAIPAGLDLWAGLNMLGGLRNRGSAPIYHPGAKDALKEWMKV